MRKLKLKWANFILKKGESRSQNKEKKRQEEMAARAEARKNFHILINGFIDRMFDELEKDFVEKNKPMFEVGDSAILNWYAEPNGWEGNFKSCFSHIKPEVGPIKVKITKRWVDAAYFTEQVDLICGKGKLDLVTDYTSFKGAIERYSKHHLYLPLLGYQYKFKSNHKKAQSNYGMREHNFVLPGTIHGDAVLKLWGFEKAREKAYSKIEVLNQKIADIQKDFNETLNLYR